MLQVQKTADFSVPQSEQFWYSRLFIKLSNLLSDSQIKKWHYWFQILEKWRAPINGEFAILYISVKLCSILGIFQKCFYLD